MNRHDLEYYLGRHGCQFFRHGRRHDVWINTANGQSTAIPRHRVIKRGTVRGICRDLGVSLPPGV